MRSSPPVFHFSRSPATDRSHESSRDHPAATADVQTTDAALIEATRAVFGNVPTGYIEDGGGEGDFKIVEVARSILPKPEK